LGYNQKLDRRKHTTKLPSKSSGKRIEEAIEKCNKNTKCSLAPNTRRQISVISGILMGREGTNQRKRKT
jgi:hypothetical protein